MKTKSPCAFGLALSLSLLISIPADVCAAPQAADSAPVKFSCDSGGEHRSQRENHCRLGEDCRRLAGSG